MPADSPKAPPQSLRSYPSSAKTRLEKVVIGSLDDPGKGVEAQYNPKELSIEKTVPWQEHKVTRQNDPDLEFTGGGARTMNLELTFDGFETGQSVEDAIVALTELATVRDPSSKNEELLRPHLVAVAWGGPGGVGTQIAPFRGVIASLSTKYTMFLPDGTPARATCQIKITEAQRLGLSKNR